MSLVIPEDQNPSRKSIDDGSESTTLEDDQKTFTDDKALQRPNQLVQDLSVVPKTDPFPVMDSLEEITQTLSQVKSNQTAKYENNNEKEKDLTSIVEDDTDNVIKGGTFKQTPYHTEGIRNPGWFSVISCFFVNFFIFGTVFSWGDYQRLYFNEVYAGQTELLQISFAGSAVTALILGLGVFITPMIQRMGFRGTMIVGTIGAPLSLILASFATQLWHIYLSQGILLGITSAFVFQPTITLPSQWFTAKRAFATGIAVSGSGVGGYRNTLRVQGAFGFGLLCIATALATSRYRPPTKVNDKWYVFFDTSLISRNYILLLAFGFFVPFGYLAPFFLAPQFVQQSLGLDAQKGAAMISVLSGANVVCRVSLGYLADRVGKFNTMLACTFLAGIFAMLIWQFSFTYGTFAAFCTLYGLTAGGFVSLVPVVTAEIVGVENIQKGLGMAYMMTIFGSLCGSPLVGLLVSRISWIAAIQFCGAVQVVAAFILVVLRMFISKGKVFVKV